MEKDGLQKNRKGRMSRIIVPIFILLIVAGIWFIKDSQRTPGHTTGEDDGGDLVLLHENFAFNATEEFDFEELKTHKLPIIIDFGSETCPPCRQMAPTLKKVHKDMQGKAIIKYVDVDKFAEIASEYPVKVVPTQFFFDKDGNPYMPEDSETSQMLIYTAKDTGDHVLTAHEGVLTEKQMLEILKEMGMEE